MSEGNPFPAGFFGSDPEIDGWVIHDIALEYGELTPASLERIDLSHPMTPTRVARRRERVERTTESETMQLCEVMDGLSRQLPDFEPGLLHTVLASSHTVGIGFGLLPNSVVAPEGLNEVTALREIRQQPAAWLHYQTERGRFVYTADAQQLLREAYKSDAGCPAIGLEVSNDGGVTTSNLFIMYWGMLTSKYRPY